MPLAALSTKHDYQDCPDEHCPLFPCRVYKEGHADGYAEGRAIGHAEGYVAGYSDGETAGYQAGYADGAASTR